MTDQIALLLDVLTEEECAELMDTRAAKAAAAEHAEELEVRFTG
ncbi:hypothetical protein AB0C84_45590 [Actinomadura sp. NPDC048955]